MIKILEAVNNLVWGIPALIAILGVGIFLTIQTKFAQFRLFPKAMGQFMRQFMGGKKKSDGISPYRALCTALAATVGTGNLAGVAGAIVLGGPGAIFWMWICAFLGMITKFAEVTLAISYRKKNNNGELVGGPMYMIQKGMGKKWKWLAAIYCFFGVVASFGVGNATQINTVIGGINSAASALGAVPTTLGNAVMGLILGILVVAMLLGGAKKIGETAEKLVPFASLGYLLLGAVVLILRADAIPRAFSEIIMGAFSSRAVTGGMIGSAFTALRIGASRGVFTNEAGMGTASIAHASANVEHPVEQGLLGIMEVFLDTIVICTVTALVILCSGVAIPYGVDKGVTLAADAFSQVCGRWVTIPIALALCCFAFATVLGWGLYGIRCAQYLFGESAWKCFAIAQGAMVILGAVMNTQTVWMLSECVNGLMAIPNLLALAWLSPNLMPLIRQYNANA